MTYRSTSQMRRGEKFSQQAVPVTKELHTQRQRVAVTDRQSNVSQKHLNLSIQDVNDDKYDHLHLIVII